MAKHNLWTLITSRKRNGALVCTVRLFGGLIGAEPLQLDKGIAHSMPAALALGEAMLKGAHNG